MALLQLLARLRDDIALHEPSNIFTELATRPGLLTQNIFELLTSGTLSCDIYAHEDTRTTDVIYSPWMAGRVFYDYLFFDLVAIYRKCCA